MTPPIDDPIEHPLAVALRAAAVGRFPAPDGGVDVLAADAAGTQAVIAFTGHAVVLTERAADDPLLADADGYGGATSPRLLTELAGPSGWIGSHDLVLVRLPGPVDAPALPELAGHDDHPRVLRSRHHRRGVQVFGDVRGLVTLGRGLVDRREVSVELTGAEHGSGAGRALLAGALASGAVQDVAEPVWAQVAPGNAASLRMFLACGFVPICSEVLFDPAGA